MAVVKLTTDNFEQEVLQAQQPVLVDFYADWCGPCKMMAPIVETLSEELSDVKVCHINIDENIDIAQKYRVMSIPTFIAFKGGEESGRQIGAIPKTAPVSYTHLDVYKRQRLLRCILCRPNSGADGSVSGFCSTDH